MLYGYYAEPIPLIKKFFLFVYNFKIKAKSFVKRLRKGYKFV